MPKKDKTALDLSTTVAAVQPAKPISPRAGARMVEQATAKLDEPQYPVEFQGLAALQAEAAKLKANKPPEPRKNDFMVGSGRNRRVDTAAFNDAKKEHKFRIKEWREDGKIRQKAVDDLEKKRELFRQNVQSIIDPKSQVADMNAQKALDFQRAMGQLQVTHGGQQFTAAELQQAAEITGQVNDGLATLATSDLRRGQAVNEVEVGFQESERKRRSEAALTVPQRKALERAGTDAKVMAGERTLQEAARQEALSDDYGERQGRIENMQQAVLESDLARTSKDQYLKDFNLIKDKEFEIQKAVAEKRRRRSL